MDYQSQDCLLVDFHASSFSVASIAARTSWAVPELNIAAITTPLHSDADKAMYTFLISVLLLLPSVSVRGEHGHSGGENMQGL